MLPFGRATATAMDLYSTSEMPVQRPANEAEQFLRRQQQLRRQQGKRLELDNLFEWQEPVHTIPGRIATIVERYPDNLAVADNAVSYTYRELELASNRVANALLSEGGAEPEIVSLLLSPTSAAVVVALGVLKSGKAYVGYDDIYPLNRYEQIMADTDCRTIVADSYHNDLGRSLAMKDRKLLLIDQLFDYPDHDPDVRLGPDTVALLNYSSGTTGKPKGIVHTHHSIVAQASGFAVLSCLNSTDRVVNTSSLAWADTFWRFFGSLFFGAVVTTIDVRRLHVTQVMDWIDEIGVTVVVGRAYIRQILSMAGDRQFQNLRLVHLGGDTIYDRDIIATRKTFPKAIVTVGLGSSEAGRATEWIIDLETAVEGVVVHVGLPAPGITVRLLDNDGQDVAPGKSGEIAIQSSYLAKEYWKQPDLTAKRLLHAAGEGPGLYLTGDVGRIRADGALDHLGRKDFQIKIHGYQVPVVDIER